MKATILLAGRLVPTESVRAQIAGSRIIAADGGIAHAKALGVTPDLWVGDFDSASPADISHHANVPRRSFPPAKDMTDGALAAEIAIEGGAMELIFVGAFGGRFDHAFANLAIMLPLAQRGITCVATSGDEEAVPILPGQTNLAYAAGTVVSLSPLIPLQGLSIGQARWPLASEDVPFGSTLTLSNVSEGDISITLEKGLALAVAQVTGHK
ncbi:MAG: thiamine diphosphokinase [Pseudomonadota bacterium]